MSPKSGTAGTAVLPIDPKLPEEADKADPGEMSEVKAREHKMKAGKYGSVKPKPYVPPQTPEEKEQKQSWIAVEMKDEDGKPLAGERYEVVLTDGQVVAGGTLDEKGCARVEGIEPGQCTIRFPGLEDDMWESK